MYLIKDYEPVAMLRKVQLRISEFGPIRGKLQVKVPSLGFTLCRGAKAKRAIGCKRVLAVQLYRRYGAAELNLGDASSE